ncbi:hypothetical protein SD51_06010 [Alicyclobacillus tengchongensis]|nr:hypothetical protein SD51_06010 [Alicyclobacillus tengchongensis]
MTCTARTSNGRGTPIAASATSGNAAVSPDSGQSSRSCESSRASPTSICGTVAASTCCKQRSITLSGSVCTSERRIVRMATTKTCKNASSAFTRSLYRFQSTSQTCAAKRSSKRSTNCLRSLPLNRLCTPQLLLPVPEFLNHHTEPSSERTGPAIAKSLPWVSRSAKTRSP